MDRRVQTLCAWQVKQTYMWTMSSWMTLGKTVEFPVNT